MIIEGILSVLKWILLGVISLLPTLPVVRLDSLDGVFQLLSLADLVVNIRVLGSCLVTLLIVMNIQHIWGVIMWVVRKIPGVN